MEQEDAKVGKGQLFKKNAAKALDVARTMPRALVATPSAPYLGLEDQVHDQLVRELHTYPRKHPRIARVVWLVGGIMGLHRFYLGQVGPGILMLCTGGGALVWWIVDGFMLNGLVEAFNREQALRESSDRPPLGMDYVPVAAPDALLDYPAWAEKRLHPKGRARSRRRYFFELLADVVALMFFGYVLGAVTVSSGYSTAAWAVGAIVLMINFADYLIPVHGWPIASGMIRWDYRLRLFYHFNEPGRRLQLYVRPLVGLFYAPFRKKARSEVLLYLELGSVFVAARALLGLFGGDAWAMIIGLDFSGFIGNWIKGIVLGFFTIYGFAAPIGAIMMKHILLRRPNYVRWGLSLVILFFLVSGFGAD